MRRGSPTGNTGEAGRQGRGEHSFAPPPLSAPTQSADLHSPSGNRFARLSDCRIQSSDRVAWRGDCPLSQCDSTIGEPFRNVFPVITDNIHKHGDSNDNTDNCSKHFSLPHSFFGSCPFVVYIIPQNFLFVNRFLKIFFIFFKTFLCGEGFPSPLFTSSQLTKQQALSLQ